MDRQFLFLDGGYSVVDINRGRLGIGDGETQGTLLAYLGNLCMFLCVVSTEANSWRLGLIYRTR